MQQTRYNLLQLKWWNRLNNFIQSGNLQGANRFVQGIFKEITTTGVKTLYSLGLFCDDLQFIRWDAEESWYNKNVTKLTTQGYNNICYIMIASDLLPEQPRL
jgi:hypothetical protein